MHIGIISTTDLISTVHDCEYSKVNYLLSLNAGVMAISSYFPLFRIHRLPEHCIEYVKIVQWDKENPFEAALDGDDPQHVSWVYEKSQERASSYNITGLSYRLVQGVLKNIIPAVASTNAIVAASCVTEVFKIATSCYASYNNSMLFNDIDGIYTYIYESEKKDNCLNCSIVPIAVTFDSSDTVTLEQLIEFLCTDAAFQMKNPGNTLTHTNSDSTSNTNFFFIFNFPYFGLTIGITTEIDGKNKTLYMPTVQSIEERTRPNLKRTLEELHIPNGQELVVTDQSKPNSSAIRIKYSNAMED